MRIGISDRPKKIEILLFMETTSAELLRQFRQREPGAAEELFQRYVCRLNELVNRQLHRSLRRRMDPEDAVHSAYRSFSFGRNEAISRSNAAAIFGNCC